MNYEKSRLNVAVLIFGLAVVVMAEVEDALRRQVADEPGRVPATRVPPADVDAVAVPGVYPLVQLVGGLELRAIGGIAIAVLLLLIVAMRLSSRAAIALLALIFCLFSYLNHRTYLVPRMERAGPRLALAAEIERLGPPATVAYDSAHREPALVAGLQYLLQDTRFERFHSTDGQEPTADAVVASGNWGQAERLGARFVVASGRGGALWLLPGEAQESLPRISTLGLNLGAEARPDVRQSGFYRTEDFDGEPGRWTNGAAMLAVPIDPQTPPRALEIEALAPGPKQTRLEVVANGVRLMNRDLTPEASTWRLVLAKVPLGDELRLELRSETFYPAAFNPASRDRRKLGIVVKTIRLVGRQERSPSR